ncbi:MAG TPA: type IV secretion system DNA-binding domain-containing protein [Candidatus Dojkabacteria bacterium]|nr:type IV secretion system DNA-binding domain-containing protein [Candidatus Dojkabacteria bacterium]
MGLIIALTVIVLILIVVLVILFKKKPDDEEVFNDVRNPIVMQILVPRENEKASLAAEQMFASIHGVLGGNVRGTDVISFEIASTDENGIRFFVVAPQHLSRFIEGQIYAQYPNADIEYVQDYAGLPTEKDNIFVTTGEIEMEKDSIFPLKTFRSFEVDPLAAITGAMSELNRYEQVWLQVIVRPVSNYWQAKSKEYITATKEGKSIGGPTFGEALSNFVKGVGSAMSTDEKPVQKEIVKLLPGQEEELSEIANKMLKVGFEFKIRVVTKAEDQFRSEQLLRDVIASFKQFTTAHLNNLVYAKPGKDGKEMYEDYLKRDIGSEGDIVNIEELASLYHLPNISVETPNIAWSRSRKLEPPMNLPRSTDDDVTTFAETSYRDMKVEFGLKRRDRVRHFYLLGKTGTGKSTLFKNMFISDVLAGDGACFVDPHGDTVEELLSYIPPNRVQDVVYFNPTDVDHPVGFNLLELKDKSQRDLIADGVVEVFKKQFGDSWGPRLQYILTNTVATLAEAQGTSLLAVTRILIDKNYRKFILKQLNDPILYKFWAEEYAQMAENSRLVTEAVSPIQNKVGRFISSAVTRNIVGQVKSTIDLREIMDNQKILLVNLAQGRLGEETASLLGGMIITRLQATAMERVDIPEEERKDFFLFVDEFQNFATESFAKILSEARKYKLNLTMTNQYIDQLPLTVRQAIFGNVGTLGSFVVSQADASILEKEFAPVVSSDDLVSLDAYAMYIKLCIDGMTSVPFSAKSLPVRYQKYNLRDEIVAASREKYGMPREEIEDRIMRWSNQTYSDKGNRSNMKKEEDTTKKPIEERVKDLKSRKEGKDVKLVESKPKREKKLVEDKKE